LARLRGRILVLSLIALLFLALAVQAETSRVVPAEEILKKIELGQPVEYDGVTIVGDLDIDKLKELPSVNEGLFYQEDHVNLSSNKRHVASLIRITNSTIQDGVNFNNTRFDKNVDLGNTKFEVHAGFRGAIFNGGADVALGMVCALHLSGRRLLLRHEKHQQVKGPGNAWKATACHSQQR